MKDHATGGQFKSWLCAYFLLFMSDPFLSAADNLIPSLVLIRLAIIIFGLGFVFRSGLTTFKALGLSFLFWMLIVGLLHGNLLESAPIELLKYIGLAFVLDSYLKSGEVRLVSNCFFVASLVAMVINLLFNPRELGLYSDVYEPSVEFYGRTVWFTGPRNSFGEFFLLSTLLLLLGSSRSEKKRWILAFVWGALGLFMSFFVWSSSSIIVVASMLIGVVLLYLGRLPIRTTFSLVVGIATNIAIVLLRLQAALAPLVVERLHRDLTFTGRTFIWDHYLSRIGDHLIFGNGVFQEYIPEFGREYTPHNALLLVLNAYGLVGIALVGGMLLLSVPASKLQPSASSSRLFGLFLLLFLLRSLVESSFGIFIVLASIGANLWWISDQSKADSHVLGGSIGEECSARRHLDFRLEGSVAEGRNIRAGFVTYLMCLRAHCRARCRGFVEQSSWRSPKRFLPVGLDWV